MTVSLYHPTRQATSHSRVRWCRRRFSMRVNLRPHSHVRPSAVVVAEVAVVAPRSRSVVAVRMLLSRRPLSLREMLRRVVAAPSILSRTGQTGQVISVGMSKRAITKASSDKVLARYGAYNAVKVGEQGWHSGRRQGGGCGGGRQRRGGAGAVKEPGLAWPWLTRWYAGLRFGMIGDYSSYCLQGATAMALSARRGTVQSTLRRRRCRAGECRSPKILGES